MKHAPRLYFVLIVVAVVFGTKPEPILYREGTYRTVQTPVVTVEIDGVVVVEKPLN